MRKLCCMALVCGFVFAMSGCGRTEGQEPIAGDASGGLPEAAIEEALDKLDIEYIDMMLLHHPGAGDVEAYHAMERAVAEGKIRSLGLSNWYIEELEEFLPQVNITPALVQNEIHPYSGKYGIV